MDAISIEEKRPFNIKINTKVLNAICISFLIILCFLIVLPFALSDVHSGADYPYHLSVIYSLNEAWHNGTFGSKIIELIGLDYGYGTGIFYSLIPAGIAVIFMNVFGLGLTAALYLEIVLLFALSAVVVYLFINKLTKNQLLSALISIIYILYPYFYGNLYYRFAFSEMFFMLYIPMIAWGLYELIENANYKLFLPIFTIGSVLSILTHLTLSLFIAIFAILYVLINIKKLLTKYKFVPFIIACLFVLLIPIFFYVPIIVNYGVVGLANMGYNMSSIYEGLVSNFTSSSWMFSSNLLDIIVFILFTSLFIFRCVKKQVSKSEIGFYVLNAIVFVFTSPIFPWSILPSIFGMIQFVHRLLMLTSFFMVLQLAYVVKYFNFKKVKILNIALLLLVIIYSGVNCGVFSKNAFDMYNSAYFENVISEESSGFDINHGMGYWKNGDYYPNGATSNYVFYRVNGNIILSTDLDIKEFANYQLIDQLSFIVTPKDNNIVELDIPYSVLSNENVYQISSDVNNEYFEVSVVESSNGNTQLVLTQTEKECKIVIPYQENGELDNYLKENPFEFVVKSGDVRATNFIKDSASAYSVEFLTNETSIVELPTFFYKGYTVTFTDQQGNTSYLEAVHGENGFIEIEIDQSGTVKVEFNPTYVRTSNIVSIVSAVLFAILILCALIIPRKYFTNLANKITEFLKTHKTVAEILRFLIVGGIATIVDIFTMGVVMYLMERSIYPSFINVFINSPTPSTFATIMGTSVGFVVGLIVNYVLSILFVFNEKGNSRTVKGFVVFTVLSVIGLIINIIGTYIGFDLLHLNQWLVKIIMIIIVLIYNYISKRLVLFKKKPETVQGSNIDKDTKSNSEDVKNKTSNNENKDNKE